MNQAELVRLARIGADSRIAQLQAEIDAIRRQFPGSGGAGRGRGRGGAAEGAAAPRKPRQMSAAARRRISQAAKKRWEQWRKDHGK